MAETYMLPFGTIIQFRLDLDQEIYKQEISEAGQGVNVKRGRMSAVDNIKAIAKDQQLKGAENLAKKARDQMAAWLAPGGEYKIGWTGEAAANLKVVGPIQGTQYGVTDDSEANLQIRTGRAPHDSRFNDDQEKLMKWIEYKHLIYKKWEYKRKTSRRVHRLKTPHGSYATGKWWKERLSYRVLQALQTKGASSEYPERPNIGKRFFDYAHVYVEKQYARNAAYNYLNNYGNVGITTMIGQAFFNYFATEYGRWHLPNAGFGSAPKKWD